jgi:hypothetical protein
MWLSTDDVLQRMREAGEELVALEAVPFVPRREVGRDEAEAEIVAYVSQHPDSDAYDLSRALRLPFALVDQVAQDLVARGVLREGANTFGEDE